MPMAFVILIVAVGLLTLLASRGKPAMKSDDAKLDVALKVTIGCAILFVVWSMQLSPTINQNDLSAAEARSHNLERAMSEWRLAANEARAALKVAGAELEAMGAELETERERAVSSTLTRDDQDSRHERELRLARAEVARLRVELDGTRARHETLEREIATAGAKAVTAYLHKASEAILCDYMTSVGFDGGREFDLRASCLQHASEALNNRRMNKYEREAWEVLQSFARDGIGDGEEDGTRVLEVLIYRNRLEMERAEPLEMGLRQRTN